MAGEFLGSDYLQMAGQFGTSALSAAGSVAGTVGSGLSGSAGYLSQLAQQAYAPRPELAPPAPTLTRQSNINMPSGYSSPTGDFGSGVNFSIFNSSPVLSAKSQSSPVGQPNILSGIGDWMSGAGNAADRFLGGTGGQPLPPPQIKQDQPSYISGGPAWTNKQIDQPLTMASNIRPSTQGALTINIAGAIPKPSDTYLTSMPGYTKDVGDTRTQQLVGKTVKDITTGQDIKIADSRDALEYQRQEALAGLNPSANEPNNSPARAAQYYRNELDKLAQNDIRLSSDYHYQAKKTGLRQEVNPWENTGDSALAFLKGGNINDNLLKNYAFNQGVTGPQGVLNLLPGGKGSQEAAWDTALGVKSDRVSNYLPAIAAWRASEGTMGPYERLGSYTSEGTKIPVPAENISAMPKGYQDILPRIAAGERGATSTYTFNFPELSSIAPVAGSSKSEAVANFAAKPGEFGTVEMKSSGTGLAFMAPSAAGTITPITSAAGTGSLGATESPKLYAMDNLYLAKESGLKNIDLQKTDLLNTQKAFLAAGGKGSYDAKGDFSFEADANSPMQVALGTSILTKSTTLQSDVDKVNAMPLTPASEAKKPEEDTSLLGRMGSAYEGTNTWLGENITKKYIPSYEGLGSVFLQDTLDKGVLGISGIQKSAGMKPLYEKENAYDLLPSQKFLAYNRPEGFTKTVLAYDPLTDTTRKTVVTTGGMAEDNPLGWSARAVQSGIQGAFNMPREKPLEAATWLLMPGAFKAAEGAIGTIGVKVLPKVITGSPWTADVLQAGKGLLMGQFLLGEAAKVPGYTLDIAAPLTGGNEGKILSRTIEGYDAQGNPIYASQSATGWGTRGGEFFAGATLMTAGSGLVAPYKFAYKEKLPAVESHFTTGGRQASSYLESKLQPGVEKFYKVGDVARILTTGKTEITQKPGSITDLARAKEMFEVKGGESITIPERGGFGTFETGKTRSVPFSERLTSAKDIWKSADNKGIGRAAGKASSNTLPNVAMETQPGKSIEISKVEAKVAEPLQKTWTETNLPSLSKLSEKFASKGKSAVEVPSTTAASKVGYEDSRLQYQNKVAQRNLNFAKDLSPLEQEAYQRLIDKSDVSGRIGKSGVFSEKGSIGQQATEAADLGITGKVTGKNRGVGDIDILSEKPEVFNKLMAEEIQAILIERGYKNVGVKITSPEGRRFDFELFGKTRNILPESVSGFRNYASRAYEITAKSPEGKPISYKMDSGIDLKLYGMDQPLVAGEGRFNVRSLFTPAEERSSGFWNTLMLTPGRTPISMPKSMGETLFGPSTSRQKFKEDYLMTQEGTRYSNPMMSSATEATTAKPTSISRLYSTFTDKMDNIRQTSRMSLSRNPSAIEENMKFGKSVWDANNIYNKFEARYKENLASGRMTPKEKVYAENALKNMKTGLDTINTGTIEMRTSSGKIERFRVSELVDKYDMKVKSQFGGQAIEATTRTMSPFEAIEARTFTSGKSAAVVTPKGMANLQLSAPGRVGTVGEVSANIRPDVFSFNEKVSAKEAKTESKSKTIGKGIPASVSASSGIKLPDVVSIGISKKGSAASALGPSASALSSASFGKAVSSPGSKSPDGSSGVSSGPSSGSSSFSSSSIYSGSSSPSSGSSSGSSSSSMGSRSSYSGGSMFGAPFLAPPGGGGGGGGAKGHAAGIIKNPLSALRVASEGQFKRMFDFSLPNKLAGDVSKNLRQTQPYGTAGASGAFSRGASSSIQEATSLGIKPTMKAMRKHKKSKPKVKTGKKKGTYK